MQSQKLLRRGNPKSRQNDGIVTVKTTGKNQDGVVVASYLRTALIPKQGTAVEDKIDY